MKIVIRAGGIGTRLWPMSRKNNPKQFQKIVGDKTMVASTYERISSALASADDLFVSVNELFKDKIRQDIPALEPGNIIVETDTRNTGPAMCLEVCFLLKHCKEDDVIATLPSDDFISDSEAFISLLKTTEEFIINNPDYILTPAVIPNWPDTGYTYFKAGKNLMENGEESIYSVADVVEKPNEDYCKELIKTGVYYCHTGMYLWRLGHIAELFKKFQPRMFEVCTDYVELSAGGKIEEARELYGQLEKISVESAITDKAPKIAMSVSNRIGWSDLGKWHIIKRVLEKSEEANLTSGDVTARESRNNLVYSTVGKKIIVVNDVNDLVVIDTPDALFISSLKNSAEIKQIVDKLKAEDKEEYL